MDYLSKKDINSNCGLIRKAGVLMDQRIHTSAVSALHWAAVDGDLSLITNVLQSLPQGYRVEGFKVWVMTYSPVRINGDNKKIELVPEGNKLYTKFDLETAAATPFWNLAAAKEKTVMTLSPAAIRAMLDKYAKYVDEADAEGKVYNKAGQLIKKIDGDVVQLREYINNVRKAAA